jgi:thiol-disulfide isomerase/thioredoxin
MKIIIFLYCFAIIACSSKPKQKPFDVDEIEVTSGEIILLGEINLANLQTSNVTPWFNEEFDRVTIDTLKVKDLKPFTKDLKIKIFMGSWCDDSKRELPPFFKILVSMDFDQNHLQMFAMSEEKTTPSNFEKGLEIYNVPTIIFFKNGEEINRFVELPVENLESDIKKIITGAAYAHSYAL